MKQSWGIFSKPVPAAGRWGDEGEGLFGLSFCGSSCNLDFFWGHEMLSGNGGKELEMMVPDGS